MKKNQTQLLTPDDVIIKERIEERVNHRSNSKITLLKNRKESIRFNSYKDFDFDVIPEEKKPIDEPRDDVDWDDEDG